MIINKLEEKNIVNLDNELNKLFRKVEHRCDVDYLEELKSLFLEKLRNILRSIWNNIFSSIKTAELMQWRVEEILEFLKSQYQRIFNKIQTNFNSHLDAQCGTWRVPNLDIIEKTKQSFNAEAKRVFEEFCNQVKIEIDEFKEKKQSINMARSAKNASWWAVYMSIGALIVSVVALFLHFK